MSATYFLHIPHEQICGFQVLMAFLKAFKDSFCFISSGTRSKILRPKYEMIAVPLNTNFTRGLLNSNWLLQLNYSWKYLKISVKIFVAIPLDTLYISITRVCRLRVCTERDMSWSSRFWKLESLSQKQPSRGVFRKRFIFIIF